MVEGMSNDWLMCWQGASQMTDWCGGGDKSNVWLMRWYGNALALALALEIRATWRNFRYLIFCCPYYFLQTYSTKKWKTSRQYISVVEYLSKEIVCLCMCDLYERTGFLDCKNDIFCKKAPLQSRGVVALHKWKHNKEPDYKKYPYLCTKNWGISSSFMLDSLWKKFVIFMFKIVVLSSFWCLLIFLFTLSLNLFDDFVYWNRAVIVIRFWVNCYISSFSKMGYNWCTQIQLAHFLRVNNAVKSVF